MPSNYISRLQLSLLLNALANNAVTTITLSHSHYGKKNIDQMRKLHWQDQKTPASFRVSKNISG